MLTYTLWAFEISSLSALKKWDIAFNYEFNDGLITAYLDSIA